ncbi:MAG: helix-turn-helix domain-containing protein [Spirochaetia bacterium]
MGNETPHFQFAAVESDIIDDPRMKKEHLTVYLSLAHHADSNGANSRPSVKTITSEARCSRARAISCINDMVAWGYVEREAQFDAKGDRDNNLYSLPLMRKRREAFEAKKRGSLQAHPRVPARRVV